MGITLSVSVSLTLIITVVIFIVLFVIVSLFVLILISWLIIGGAFFISVLIAGENYYAGHSRFCMIIRMKKRFHLMMLKQFLPPKEILQTNFICKKRKLIIGSVPWEIVRQKINMNSPSMFEKYFLERFKHLEYLINTYQPQNWLEFEIISHIKYILYKDFKEDKDFKDDYECDRYCILDKSQVCENLKCDEIST